LDPQPPQSDADPIGHLTQLFIGQMLLLIYHGGSLGIGAVQVAFQKQTDHVKGPGYVESILPGVQPYVVYIHGGLL
jgi:hypothetical protein